MNHNYIRDSKFNILTIRYESKKGVFSLTGETADGIAIGDTINYLANAEGHILEVVDIAERRDSRDFARGNNLFYSCHCKAVPNTEQPTNTK